MEYLQTGQMIRELRKRKGLSQEQLCEGLCEPPTMSKIEKGRQYPNKKLLDALLVRLHECAELQVPLSPSDFERAQIEREVISRVSNHDYELLELAERYRNCASSMNKHEQQFYRFTQAVHATAIPDNWAFVLAEFERAIQLTIPRYRAGADISTAMLTSVEFTILNNIAICLWFLDQRKEAVALMEQLYEVLDGQDLDREEYAKRLPLIAYHLSMWLGVEAAYEKSLAVAEKGIQCSVKYGKYALLADLLYNKGYTLLKLGRDREGTAVLQKAFMLMYAGDNAKAYEAFRNDLLQSFGAAVWDGIRGCLLPDSLSREASL